MFLSAPLTAQNAAQDNPYPPFVIDIPQGWQAAYKAGSDGVGQSLELTSPDRAASFSLSLEAVPAKGWAKMVEDLSVRPKPDHSPPNMQADGSFVVTYNDSVTGMTGRKIYQRLDDRRYLVQTALGFHADLPRLINAVEIDESARNTDPAS
jgi:hypothetical protein